MTHYQQKEDGVGPYKELVSRNELSHISAEVVICCVWNRPKKMYTCTATFHTCFLAILLIPVVHLLMGSSLVIEDEGLYQPDSRTILVMIFRAIDISIILQFYKHNSLPFGPIQALIAFYKRSPYSLEALDLLIPKSSMISLYQRAARVI